MSHQLCANSIRALAMDAVEKAASGHPGMPMGMADIATVLWQQFLSHCPGEPNWFNRDRFVLSNGHGSMLLYALLHLTGYDVSIDDLKNFRQLGSGTAGHPEYKELPGVETTTGPLGQGLANAVGMALAEKLLAEKYNQPSLPLVDHFTYVFCGDGCLMEGISHEVCSFAGTLNLGKLIVFYDSNGISIDGHIDRWFTDNTAERFKAYGWQVIEVDGHDSKEIAQATSRAKEDLEQPTIIICKTVIGFGAPENLAGSEKAHGAPLGTDAIRIARENLGWSYAPFEIPSEVYQQFDAKEKGAARFNEWLALWNKYKVAHPELAKQFEQQTTKTPLADFELDTAQDVATRAASKLMLDVIADKVPALLGGSADLTGSNCTQWKGASSIFDGGRHINYGVREFGMFAIMNGLALHGGFIPFGGTFLTFLDYGRNAVRMSALMGLQCIYVFTHDSIGLGEDGPTHQPVEHLAMLRATPNIETWRPADVLETQVAWQEAINHTTGPTALCLSRQKCPDLGQRSLASVRRGVYILHEADSDITFIATGSEVALAVEVAKKIGARVVSMPCMERARKLSKSELNAMLGKQRVFIEAASAQSWYEFAREGDMFVTMDSFGASAPAKDLYEHFGFGASKILSRIKTEMTS